MLRQVIARVFRVRIAVREPRSVVDVRRRKRLPRQRRIDADVQRVSLIVIDRREARGDKAGALPATGRVNDAIALYKVHGTASGSARRRAYTFLIHRAALEFIRDCVRPRRWMPYTVGVLRATRFVPTILALDAETLRKEYVGIQRQLYELCQ